MRFFPLLNYPSLLVSMSADCRQFNVTLLLWLTLFLPACRRGKYAYNFLFTIFAFSTSAANTQNCLVCRLFSTTPPPLPSGREKSLTLPFALCFYVICTSNVAYNQAPNNNKSSTAHKHLHCVHLQSNDNEMPMPKHLPFRIRLFDVKRGSG